jgi:ADP-heptose:LPS heptosyltransferase
VVNAPFRDLLDAHPDLDQVVPLERGKPGISSSGVAGIARASARLMGEAYDLAIDLQGLMRSGVMTAATRARIRVGMADAREGSRWFYTHHVEAPRRGMHAVDRVLRVVAALGLEGFIPSFQICPSEQDQRWARYILSSVPGPRVIFNLGGRWMTKRWPTEHFAEIARRAASVFGAGLIVVGADVDRTLAWAFRGAIAPLRVLDLSGQTTLLQLAALARESDLFLSNDSGPLHLAAAAGASVVGVYTCTNPGLTGPYGPRTATVQSCVWCAPSFRKTCDRLDCFAELNPNRVWPVVRRCLSSSLESSPSTSSLRARFLPSHLAACPDFP